MMPLAAVNWHSVFFLVGALAACGFALVVLFSRDIVRMAFALVLSLGSVALLFFLAGAHFVGAMQLMIYVGGTMVLLIFGVMLTGRAAKTTLKTRGGEWVVALVVGGLLLTVLLQTAFRVESWRSAQVDPEKIPRDETVTTSKLGMGLVGVRVDQPSEADGEEGGNRSAGAPPHGLSGYLLPFELVGVHLLVVLVGAAYLARTRRRIRARVARSGTRDDKNSPAQGPNT